MNFIAQTVAEFVANVSNPNPLTCRCQGGGWINSPYDSWEKCPHHFTGQTHPEDFDYTETETQVLSNITTTRAERRDADLFFDVTVFPTTGSREPYTRCGNLQWLGDFVNGILRDEPGAKLIINP